MYNVAPGIDMILKDDIKGIQKLFGVKGEKICFETQEELVRYVCGYNLSLLFDGKRKVKCIFHPDEKPSASIHCFSGCYLYTCHSANCEHAGSYNIVTLVEKIKGYTRGQALNYIRRCFRCYSKHSEEKEQDLNTIYKNIEILESLESMAPTANKILGKDKEILMHLYENVLNGKYTRKESGQITLSISCRQLMKEMGKEIKVSQRLAVMAYLKLLRKIPLEELPDETIDELIMLSRGRKENILKVTTYIEMERLTAAKIEEVENTAIKWKKLGYLKTKFTAREIYQKEGMKVFDIYSQL